MSALGDVIRTVNATISQGYSITPIAYENISFNSSDYDEFIVIAVEPIINSQMTIDNVNNMYRLIGRIKVEINTKPNMGTITSADIGEEVSKLFRSKDINSIKFGTPRYSPLGVTNGFYQAKVDIPFYLDSIY